MTDRETGLAVTLVIVVVMVIIYKRIQNEMILALKGSHLKRLIAIESMYSQSLREARDQLRILEVKFDQLNGEHDWISSMYQDQMRASQEQDDRISFLETRLREFGQLNSEGSTAPFSAPASQIKFTNPPRRLRAAVGTSSPLAQSPPMQMQENDDE